MSMFTNFFSFIESQSSRWDTTTWTSSRREIDSLWALSFRALSIEKFSESFLKIFQLKFFFFSKNILAQIRTSDSEDIF